MRVGIIGAMKQEIILLQNKITQYKNKTIGNYICHIGYLHGINIILIESGIGKVSAAIATTIILMCYQPDIIISIGTAGSLSKKLNIGDIILPNKTCYYDVNLKIFNYKIGQIPNNPKYFIINKPLILILKRCIKKLHYQYQEGLMLTGDSFIHEQYSRRLIKNNFPSAIAIEMESTAIAQTCYKFNTSVLIIRAISDTANKNAMYNFKNNINKTSYRILKIVECLLKKLI
ncbi:MAG TPA: 5'-methylthioadenosine/adenosylhomocysteine nucleosidase [Buchnera sp. (in: enterobacteria)]|nr:5'-methylthioadenosine/adenosylhomocysteine nucleosidase [Buchnera sp. (in: enterobacteria)]